MFCFPLAQSGNLDPDIMIIALNGKKYLCFNRFKQFICNLWNNKDRDNVLSLKLAGAFHINAFLEIV
jgi:hypothetical protein